MSTLKKLSFPPAPGDIIMANLDPVHGDVQKSKRPYLVISLEPFNQHFGLCVVAPITNGIGAGGGSLDAESPFFIDVKCKRGSVSGKVIANQFATIDWRHDGYECSYLGAVRNDVLDEVKNALKVLIGA